MKPVTKASYKQIAQYLVDFISRAEEGEQLPTENQLATKFGVSHLTVRKAIKQLEIESSIIRIPGKGTFVRKKPVAGQLIHILFVLPPMTSVEDAFLQPIVSECFEDANKIRAIIHIYPYNYNWLELMNMCQDFSVDGVIWTAPFVNHFETIIKLQEYGYPVMVINRILEDERFNYVSTDHQKAAGDITQFLISKGHKRIGFVGLIEDDSCYRQRFEGFKKAMDENGLEFSEQAVVKIKVLGYVPKHEFSDWHQDFKQMIEKYKPTALLFSGGHLLEKILRDSNERMILDNLEIATFDEVPYIYQEKQYIHEVIQPLQDLGKYALGEIKKIISCQQKTVKIKLQPSVCLKNKRG